MIRVLHYGLGSRLGGIETYLYKLYEHIDKSKFRFDYLTTKGESVYFKEEFTNMGSKFYSITSRSENFIKNRRELIDLLKQENFDIIHCHMNSLSYSSPISIGMKTNNKVIVHSRNAQAPKSYKTRMLHNVNTFLLQKKHVKRLAVSDLAGEWMFGDNSNYKVINNGINIERFEYNRDSRMKVRNELNLDKNFCVIHVGAFREQKNHSFLLKVFNEVVKLKGNSKLLLVGTGELKNEIEKEAKELRILDKIKFLGNRNDIPELLSASDVFLFPSLYEGFPNAVLEAQTSGLPCLISNTITTEVLINDNTFNFSLNKNPSEWASKLLTIPSDEDRIKGAENIMKCGYSVKDEVKKIEGVYMEILKGNKS